MKIYKLLNPYKLLCEAEQLDEALSTDFKIGFEMEGVCTREGFNSYMLPGYHSQREPSGVVAELFNDINKTLGFGQGKIESDSSLRPSPEKGGWTFEYGSPIIDFNPTNINKIYHFLKKVPELQIYTNETCSFHTHMSFKDLDKINGAWVMCCLAIDGEMQVNFAMNRELRDQKYPFTRLKGKDVNALIFPTLSSANAGYQLLQSMQADGELIGPIQMGLNKPIHFTDFESSVRDIVNITAVAVIDAIVAKKKVQG